MCWLLSLRVEAEANYNVPSVTIYYICKDPFLKNRNESRGFQERSVEATAVKVITSSYQDSRLSTIKSITSLTAIPRNKNCGRALYSGGMYLSYKWICLSHCCSLGSRLDSNGRNGLNIYRRVWMSMWEVKPWYTNKRTTNLTTSDASLIAYFDICRRRNGNSESKYRHVISSETVLLARLTYSGNAINTSGRLWTNSVRI